MDFRRIVGDSSIHYVNPNRAGSGVVFMGAADWGWEPSTPEAIASRMQLLGRYRDWFVRLRLLFSHPTPDVARKLTVTNEFVERWLLRPDTFDHSIPRSVERAVEVATGKVDAIRELLDLARHGGSGELRVVPDTSALMRNPDLASYQRSFGSTPFVVHLTPPVLAELDDLKDRGKTQDVRDSAQAVVRRIKGMRDKGRLAVGVTLTKSVTVKTEAKEVDARAVLDWLDPAVPDDRLIAYALRLQSDHPSGVVVLVTSDLNLQTKADAAGLPYLETPPTTKSLQAELVARIRHGVPGKRGAQLELSNDGAARATNITYSLRPAEGHVGTSFSAGPWELKELRAGNAADPVALMLWTEPSVVHAEWTDGTGAQSGVIELT